VVHGKSILAQSAKNNSGGDMWHDMSGGMGMGWIFMVLVWSLIIAGIVVLVKWLMTQNSRGHAPPNKTAMETLQERYARGEIDRNEYEQKRRDLGSGA
jgi:putative membrane protein